MWANLSGLAVWAVTVAGWAATREYRAGVAVHGSRRLWFASADADDLWVTAVDPVVSGDPAGLFVRRFDQPPVASVFGPSGQWHRHDHALWSCEAARVRVARGPPVGTDASPLRSMRSVVVGWPTLLVTTGLWPTAALLGHLRRRDRRRAAAARVAAGRCGPCGYDRRATPAGDRCPECGNPGPATAADAAER